MSNEDHDKFTLLLEKISSTAELQQAIGAQQEETNKTVKSTSKTNMAVLGVLVTIVLPFILLAASNSSRISNKIDSDEVFDRFSTKESDRALHAEEHALYQEFLNPKMSTDSIKAYDKRGHRYLKNFVGDVSREQ